MKRFLVFHFICFGLICFGAFTTIFAQADIRIFQSSSGANQTLNSQYRYTLVASNLSAVNATNIRVQAVLPAALSYVTHIAASGTLYTNGTWSIPALPARTSKTLIVTVQRRSAANISYCAQTVAMSQADPNLSNNTSCSNVSAILATPPLITPDISVNKEVVGVIDGAIVPVNEVISYRIIATNIGPGEAYNTRIIDQLPSGLAFINSTASVGNFSNGIWVIPRLGVNERATLVVQTRRVSATLITNCATSSLDGDANLSNNQSCVSLVSVCRGNQVWNGTECVCPPNSIWNGSSCVVCNGTQNGPQCESTCIFDDRRGVCTCPTGTNLIGSRCVVCAPGTTWNGSQCVCPSGQNWGGNQCVITNTCPFPRVNINSQCVCLNGGNWNGSTCTVCTGGQTWNGSQCVCPSGTTWNGSRCLADLACQGNQVLINGQCTCPIGTVWNVDTCESVNACVAPRFINASGQCVCPGGTTWDGTTCVSACTGGQTWNGSQCVCPPGQTWNGSQCITTNTCPLPRVNINGQCVCPNGGNWNGSTCTVCTGGQTWNGSQCVCPPGQTWNGSTCETTNTCPFPRFRDDFGQCVCQSDQIWNGNACVPKCPSPRFWNGSGCSCQSDYTWTGTTCVPTCVNGQVWSGTQCICPNDQTWNGSQCVATCTGGRFWNGSSCQCANGQTWNGNQCVATCTGGRFWNGSSCQCTNGQTWNGSTCGVEDVRCGGTAPWATAVCCTNGWTWAWRDLSSCKP